MEENEISHKIIGAAIEVHRILGPGLFTILIGLEKDIKEYRLLNAVMQTNTRLKVP